MGTATHTRSATTEWSICIHCCCSWRLLTGTGSAPPPSSPGTSTINRLGASSRGLLLVVVSQRTSLTVVGREHAVLIEAMPEVLVLGIVIVAARVGVPSTHTIDRLGALVLRALHLAIGVGASIASKVGLRRDLV